VKLLSYSPVDLAAVRKEAEVWVRAGPHPNVLPIFEANIYEGHVIIVSEYAPDGSLKQWLDKHHGRAPSAESAAYMVSCILSGLEHLHVQGIIHRDLKPANILMQGECPRIADFGLARLTDTMATASSAAGTPAYMSPEAFDGKRTVRTDIWSMGVILYQLLSGQLPFQGGELRQLMKAIMFEEPPPLPQTVPSRLREVVSTALKKDARARYSNAADMRAALQQCVQGGPPEDKDNGRPDRQRQEEQVDPALRELQRALLVASSIQEVKRIMYGVEAYLAEHPHSVEGRLLKDSVQTAILRTEVLCRGTEIHLFPPPRPQHYMLRLLELMLVVFGLLCGLIYLIWRLLH
jgi:serine/threonine protein kinase